MDNTIENVNEAGDVITERVEITTALGETYDVSNFVMSLSLHEDIFSPVMTGDALMIDAAGIINTLRLAGNEYITISYRTPSFTQRITKSFYITGVEDRFFSHTDKQQMYTIKFMSIEGMRDGITAVSRKFSGTPESVVSLVYQDYLQTSRFVGKNESTPFIVTPSKGSAVTMVSPYWNPLKIINWVANRAFSTQSSAPNFLFFESNKAFRFTSIEDLIVSQRNDNKIYSQFIYFPAAGANLSEILDNVMIQPTNLLQTYFMVRNMKPFSTMDSIDAQLRGYYASHLTVKDPTLKTFHFHNYDHHAAHLNFNHTEDYTLSGGSVSSSKKQTQPFAKETMRAPMSYKALHTRQFKLHNDSTDPMFEKWALQRNSLIQDLSVITLAIEVPGRTDIEVGMLIDFLYPRSIDKPDGISFDALFDPYLSGIYVITAIKHRFMANQHTMYIEIAKDSFKTTL